MNQINRPSQSKSNSDLNTKPNTKSQNTGMATASVILGIVSFIPLLGILTGVFALILGVIARKNINQENSTDKKLATAGIILGTLGILFTFIVYGSIFYMGFVAKNSPFGDAKKELSQQLLTQDAGTIELYKKKFGNYPSTLDELSKAGYTVWGTDHYMKPFYYKVSSDGTDYNLRSLGPDGEYGTNDDIFPLE